MIIIIITKSHVQVHVHIVFFFYLQLRPLQLIAKSGSIIRKVVEDLFVDEGRTTYGLKYVFIVIV